MNAINIAWIVLGFLCLGLGIVGIILPVLPTTPFFIATLLCFGKGSKRLKNWFMGTSFHKKYIQTFYEKKRNDAQAKSCYTFLCVDYARDCVLFFGENLCTNFNRLCVFG